MARITPLNPPYDDATAARLTAMMPPGTDPIGLFRTFARNPAMTDAMRGWGGYELGRTLSIGRRLREIAILRTCARCACEYEWGVHVSFFASKVGLSAPQLTSLTHGSSADDCWGDDAERDVIDLCDQLHDHAAVDDGLWTRLASTFDDAQLLDLLMLCGWYHAISYVANGAAVAREPGTPTFADVLEPESGSSAA